MSSDDWLVPGATRHLKLQMFPSNVFLQSCLRTKNSASIGQCSRTDLLVVTEQRYTKILHLHKEVGHNISIVSRAFVALPSTNKGAGTNTGYCTESYGQAKSDASRVRQSHTAHSVQVLSRFARKPQRPVDKYRSSPGWNPSVPSGAALQASR
jgi:hypothetical protein